MSFNLNVHFTGLCGYKPNLPIEQSPTSIKVLLPLANVGIVNGKTVLEAHYPVVMVAPAQIKTASLPSPTWMGQSMAFPIAGCDVKVVVAGGSNPFKVDTTGTVDPDKPENPTNFLWTLRMREISPDLEKVDPSSESTTHSGVSARIAVSEGELSCYDTKLLSRFRIPEAKTSALKGETGRPLSHRSVLAFKGLSGAELQVTPFGGSTETIVLDGSAGSISLLIGNLCGKDLISHLTAKANPSAATSDEDFRWMYRLVAPNLPSAFLTLLPCPQEVDAEHGGGGSAGQPRCFGGIFEP